MRVVETSALSNYKVLPFDLFTENKTKILEAGEILTPGKLIMLKNYVHIYAEDLSSTEEDENETSSANQEKSTHTKQRLFNFSYESLDPDDFETVINRESCFKLETQIKIKYFYKKILDLILQEHYDDAIIKMQSLVNIIQNEIFKSVLKHEKGSSVRFLGEYQLCHPLNVAIISGLIGKKMELPQRSMDELILAALLHDIGKTKMELHDESAILSTNEMELTAHTTIGYKIIKETFYLPESIAKVALEHHENNDGSGYPKGLSNDYISEFSQIVNVANYYDNLANNRTLVSVTNNREALREMLEIGTSRFSAKVLYTFIHMFNYDDIQEFNNMMF
jgi:putative nucleotidyltransferase with HDIG domain